MILQTWAINGHPTATTSSLFDVSSELSIWGSQRAQEIRLTIISWWFSLDVSKQRMFLSHLQTHVICLMPNFFASRFMAKRIFMNFNLLCVNFKCKYRFSLVCSYFTSQFFSSQCISFFATFSEVSSYVREVPPVDWTRDRVASNSMRGGPTRSLGKPSRYTGRFTSQTTEKEKVDWMEWRVWILDMAAENKIGEEWQKRIQKDLLPLQNLYPSQKVHNKLLLWVMTDQSRGNFIGSNVPKMRRLVTYWIIL